MIPSRDIPVSVNTGIYAVLRQNFQNFFIILKNGESKTESNGVFQNFDPRSLKKVIQVFVKTRIKLPYSDKNDVYRL